jgi:hypothetical protein
MVFLLRTWIRIRTRGFLARWERMGIEEKIWSWERTRDFETVQKNCHSLLSHLSICFIPSSPHTHFITLCLTLFFSELWALRTMFPFCFHTLSKDGGLDDAVRLSYMLYSFFWVILRLLNFICRRFGTLFSLLILGAIRKNSSFFNQLWRWNRQCSERLAHKI